MATATESVTLDDDVHKALCNLAQRSGRLLGALVNDALRGYTRYENRIADAIERGITDLDARRTRTTEEVFALLEQQRLVRTRG